MFTIANDSSKSSQWILSLSVGICLVALVVACAGCCHAAYKPRAPRVETSAWPEPANPNEIILQPGDKIQINFLYWSELNSEQTIRQDGKIQLLLAGEVEAAGLTMQELKEKLLALYEKKLKKPEIQIDPVAFANQKVYVAGEVLKPGVVPLLGRVSALDAIIMAGGFNKESAKMANVVIVRRRGEKQYARCVDLRAPFEMAETQPLFVEPGDIIFVPRTNIDRVDWFVEQYVNRIIPRNAHFYYAYTEGHSHIKQDDVTQKAPSTVQVPVNP